MREKTGLQRQIREIFGDEHTPLKKHPSLSRVRKPDAETPRGPKPGDKEDGDFTSAETLRPPDSRLLEVPSRPQPGRSAPPDALPASSGVQMLEQRLRSPGAKTLATKIKERSKIAAVVLLAAFLLWRLVGMFYPSSTGDAQSPNTPGIQGRPVVALLPSAVWPIPQVYPHDIRDPMEWGAQSRLCAEFYTVTISREPSSEHNLSARVM